MRQVLTVVDIEFGFHLSTVFLLVVFYNLPLKNNQTYMHDRKLGKHNTKNQYKIAQRQTKSSLVEDGSDSSYLLRSMAAQDPYIKG